MSRSSFFCLPLLCVWLSTFSLGTVHADHHIGDLCRIKGQEENTLHGVGLVVGLKGTGDGDNKLTMRALARYMELMGHRLGSDPKGQVSLDELKGVKNVALVSVSATVPPGGAQQGDLLDCTVSAMSAKSLAGGHLLLTEMRGPRPDDKTVYGLAKGQISLDDAASPQTGRVTQGLQVETRFQNEFVRNGKLILVMNKDHASFQNTNYLADRINSQPDLGYKGARAIDQVKIEVNIPPLYLDNPAQFAGLLLDTRIARFQTDTKVIINERKKAVIVGADVEIGPVAVMHKNRLIQTGGAETTGEFVPFDMVGDGTKTKLTALVDALNALKVPAEDVIDIIMMLKHKQALFGELIIE
ncbi:MAG: flagellar basal body P-ring protein FlgI [Pirellulaceae bacterium]